MIDWFEIPETETTVKTVDVLWTYKANYAERSIAVAVHNDDIRGAIRKAFEGYDESFFRDATFHVFFRDGLGPIRLSNI